MRHRVVNQPILQLQSVTPSSNPDTAAPLPEELVVERTKLRKISLILWRWCAFSWWSQVILSVVSGVTLSFAAAAERSISLTGAGLASGLFFSFTGLFFSALSIFSTWGLSRFAAEIRQRKVESALIPARLEKKFRNAALFNLCGMGAALLSAEQIVGLLIARALSMQGLGIGSFQAGSSALVSQAVRPLDIFIIQANTNTLVAHFMSLAINMWLNRRLDKEDVNQE